KSTTLPITHPMLTENCFELIYKLCADPTSSKPTLAYLQKHDFFSRHILTPNEISKKMIDIHHLNARANIMKTIALLIFTSKDKNRAGVQEIVTLLFGQNFNYQQDNLEQQRTQMLELLDAIELVPKDKPLPIQTTLPISIEECLIKDEKGVQAYNIKLLHKMLIHARQFAIEQSGTSSGISTSLLEKLNKEIITILERAVEWNKFYKKYSAILNAFEGWKQVVEITLSQCYDMIDKEIRERVLYDLLTCLLFKLSLEGLAKALENSISQVIIRLMTKLREQRLPMENSGILPVDQCLTLLQEILTCTLRERTSQTTRGNLYSTLLNYLQYTKKLPIKQEYTTMMISESDSQELLEKGNIQILNSCNVNLITRICRDALDGRHVWKAVSFATLDTLFAYDHKCKWIQYIEK